MDRQLDSNLKANTSSTIRSPACSIGSINYIADDDDDAKYSTNNLNTPAASMQYLNSQLQNKFGIRAAGNDDGSFKKRNGKTGSSIKIADFSDFNTRRNTFDKQSNYSFTISKIVHCSNHFSPTKIYSEFF